MVTLIALATHVLLLQTSAHGLKPYTLSPSFTVSLPSAPTLLKTPTPKGAPIVHTWFVAVSDGAFVCSTVEAKINETEKMSPRGILVNYLAGYTHSSKSEELSRKDIKLGEWMGLETRMKSPDGIMSHQRCYVANGLIFQIVAMAKAPKTDLPNADAVFTSVQLPKPK
jgi:hypothetical protein